MDKLKKEFASKLLKVKAIKLQPNDPFTWASGWKSPFYCDNRKTLSFPELRNYVKLELVHAILEQFPEADAVAGVATGAIAQGALVADELNLPFVYVRSKPKDHGMQNLIEGELDPSAKVVVVEDLISTGGSSLKAVEALRKNGNEIVGMVASYTYGFPVAEKAFADANVKLVTLTDYEHVVAEALETGYIKQEDVELLHEWRKDPHKQESVFNTLSDLNNLQRLKDKFEQVKDQIPADKREQMDKIKDLKFDTDSISITAPMVGEIKMRIIDREFPKTIKFETENSPVPFNFWIQLLPTGEYSCKMKLTIKAELNMFIKGMVKKPLTEGIEKIADALAMIPYED